MKKLLLGLGTITAIAAPVASVVACGSESTATNVVNIDSKHIVESFHALFANKTLSAFAVPKIGTIVNVRLNEVTEEGDDVISDKVYTHVLTEQDINDFKVIGRLFGGKVTNPIDEKGESIIKLAEIMFPLKRKEQIEFLLEVLDRANGTVNNIHNSDAKYHKTIRHILDAKINSLAWDYKLINLSTYPTQTAKGFSQLFDGTKAGYLTVGTVLQSYRDKDPAKKLYSHSITQKDITRIKAAFKAPNAIRTVVEFTEAADMLFGTGTPHSAIDLHGKRDFLHYLERQFVAAGIHGKTYGGANRAKINKALLDIIKPLDDAIDQIPKDYVIKSLENPLEAKMGFHAFLVHNNPKPGSTIEVRFNNDNGILGASTKIVATLSQADATEIAKFNLANNDPANLNGSVGLEAAYIANMLYEALRAKYKGHIDEEQKKEIYSQIQHALGLKGKTSQRIFHTSATKDIKPPVA